MEYTSAAYTANTNCTVGRVGCTNCKHRCLSNVFHHSTPSIFTVVSPGSDEGHAIIRVEHLISLIGVDKVKICKSRKHTINLGLMTMKYMDSHTKVIFNSLANIISATI